MILKKVLRLLIVLLPASSFAQSTKIDSIPFTVSKKLLVFKGYINNVPVDFAFDTGAGLGVANSSIEEKTNFIVKAKKKKVNDANLKSVSLKNITIQQLSIGSYQFTNIKNVLHDMEFLQCNELYLLGMDVIGKLNWRINFVNNLLEVSQTAFAVDNSFNPLFISYKKSRPVIGVTIGNLPPQQCLIDFGYTGIIDIPESEEINNIFIKKQQQGTATIGLSSAMALSGLGKADTVKNIKLDNVLIAANGFKNIPATISEKINFKIGVGFFANFCNEVVLNHSKGVYYFTQKNAPVVKLNNFEARVSYTNDKLIITAKNLSQNSSAANLSMGEEIKSIDGKTIADFINNCAFLNSYYLNNNSQIIVEKLNGEKIIIKRSE
jgi:predicted aspartyl protease